jgi:RNA polymerase sigma-70 factor, ECF subfamily
VPEVSSLPRRVAIEGERSSTPAADDSDEALMLAYASGRAVAFDTLYERHRSAVYRYLLRHCGNAATADELFQDVWMRVIRTRQTYAPAARFTAWLYTLAHHRIVDHWRSAGARDVVSIDGDEAVGDVVETLPAARADEPEHRAGAREIGARLHAALAALPPLQRDAFLLSHQSELTLAEIATLTGVGIETVKSRVRYAIGKLRAALGELHEVSDER